MDIAEKFKKEKLGGAKSKLDALLGVKEEGKPGAGAESSAAAAGATDEGRGEGGITQPLADIEVNPSQPSLTEREEKDAGGEKFVVPEKFEGPEYAAVKRQYDGIVKFIASKGIDQGKYTFDYRAIFKTVPDPKNPDSRAGELEEFKNYHDYLRRLNNLTDEERKELNTGWRSQEWGHWNSPDVFTNFYEDLDNPDSELYPYRDEIRSIIVAQKDGIAIDLYAEAVKSGEIKEIADEIAGASERSPIELTEVAEEKIGVEILEERRKSEAALGKARENYVTAMLTKEKADKGVKKLDSVWEKLKDWYKHHPEGEFYEDKQRRKAEHAGGVVAEKAEADNKLSAAKTALKDALKKYRDQAVNEKISELNSSGKLEEEIRKEMEKFAKDVLLATTMREAAKIDSLKSDKQIEQMGAARKYINEKAEEFTDWYGALKPRYKIAVSAALGIGGAAGAVMGLTQVVSLVLAGQIGLRVLGSAMTTGGLGKAIESSREKLAEKRMSKEFAGQYLETLKNQNDELDDKIFERLGARNKEKVGRFVLAGTMGALVGGGALAQVVRNGFKTEFGQGMTGKMRDFAGNAIDRIKHPLSGGFDVDKEILRMQGENELLKHLPAGAPKPDMPTSGGAVTPEALTVPSAERPSGVDEVDVSAPRGPGATGVEGVAVEAGGIGNEAQEIINLKIGNRGPEGAIIDYFRGKPDLAKAFGWDGKTDISKWAGTKAHQMWLASVEEELAKPGMAAKLTEQGFTADAEGYAKAMHRIGKGFVEIAPTGEIQLTDNTTFLKAGRPALEEISGAEDVVSKTEALAPAEPLTPSAGVPVDLLSDNAHDRLVEEAQNLSKEIKKSVEDYRASNQGKYEIGLDKDRVPGDANFGDITDNDGQMIENNLMSDRERLVVDAPSPLSPEDLRIKETVTRLVEPEILTDKTFKAAAKVPLGKILAEVPPEVYEDKYSLSRYWHSLSKVGVHTPDLPGTGWFGLTYDDFRKYAEMAKFLRENAGAAERLKDITVGGFLKTYGGDLLKNINK